MEKEAIEETLLLKQGEKNIKERPTWSITCEELKKLCYLGGPMAAVNLSLFLIPTISVTIVGHLGELQLSSTALAISIANVTGFIFLAGLSSGLETLSGQAYGARQYQKLGTHTYTAIFSLIISCLLLSIFWINTGKILVFIGQDPHISSEAGKFMTWLIPSLFGYAVLQPLIRYFQAQSMILPMLISSFCTIFFHICVSWVLVFKYGLKNFGAAVAMGLSFWLNAIILGLYMKFSPSCERTRSPISMEIFRGLKQFLTLAIPSAVMQCLEGWSFELLILCSGLLPNPQLETSVLSICLNTILTLYAIPFGLAAAVSTRVSNELGAGNPRQAKKSVVTVILLAIIVMTVINSAILSCRNMFGYIFSNEKEVVDYVTDMVPLLCLSIIMDNLMGILSGVARGCGWQHLGAYVNLASFYLFGIPIAVTLAFVVKLRGKGLWIGILSGTTLQSILLLLITFFTDWEKQAVKARERLHEEKPQINTT